MNLTDDRPETRQWTLALMPTASAGNSTRLRLANVLLPGAGLVSQDRVTAGVLSGLGCWAPLTVAAYGAWIEPGLFRPQTVVVLAGIGLLAYLVGQWLLARLLDSRARRQADYDAATVPLLAAAYEHVARGDYLQAQLRLDSLLAFDREHFEGNLLQARLLAIGRKNDQARAAYARCRRLDPAGAWDWEIRRELALL